MSFEQDIIIGLAQLDPKYGATMEKNEIYKVINQSKIKKISTFDYSPEYSNTFPKLPSGSKVILKIPLNSKYSLNKITKICKDIKKKKIKIYSLSLHNANEYNIKIFRNKINEIFELKKKLNIKKIGISIYTIEDLRYFLKEFKKIDIVQIPINILDKRFLTNEFKLLKKKFKFEVHARSIFLQGILLQKENERPQYFKKWFKIFKKWDQIKIQDKIGICLKFVHSLYIVDKIIIGIKNANQLNEIIKNINYKKKINSNILSSKSLNLIDPRKWKIKRS